MTNEWVHRLVWWGLASGNLALALIMLAPLGWRLRLWHFRTSFYRLMPASAFFAASAVLLSTMALVVGWTQLDGFEIGCALGALVVGALLVYVPWHFKRTLARVPRIHDISTDTVEPPPFMAVLNARTQESANSTEYAGAELAWQQATAYPGVVPLETHRSTAEAFDCALATASLMPGWSVVAQDVGKGRIEASETSRWFGFTDDIVIRVRASLGGSRVDMRSLSRQGRSDFGVNAARILKFMAALKTRLD